MSSSPGIDHRPPDERALTDRVVDLLDPDRAVVAARIRLIRVLTDLP